MSPRIEQDLLDPEVSCFLDAPGQQALTPDTVWVLDAGLEDPDPEPPDPEPPDPEPLRGQRPCREAPAIPPPTMTTFDTSPTTDPFYRLPPSILRMQPDCRLGWLVRRLPP